VPMNGSTFEVRAADAKEEERRRTPRSPSE
jgi:hypothetical protein